MPVNIHHTNTCQQLNNRSYPNLVRYKKPLTKKRTGYKNYSPNSWEINIRLNPYHRSIIDNVHKNAGDYRASIPVMAKQTGMAERTFKKYKKQLVELNVIIQTKSPSGWQGANHYCINPDYIQKAIWGRNKPKSKKISQSYIGSHVTLLRSKPTLNSDAEIVWDGLEEDEQFYSHLSVVPEYGAEDYTEVATTNKKEEIKKEKINIVVDEVPLRLLMTPQAEEIPETLRALEPQQRRRRTESMKIHDFIKKKVDIVKKKNKKNEFKNLINDLCGHVDLSKLKDRYENEFKS